MKKYLLILTSLLTLTAYAQGPISGQTEITSTSGESFIGVVDYTTSGNRKIKVKNVFGGTPMVIPVAITTTVSIADSLWVKHLGSQYNITRNSFDNVVGNRTYTTTGTENKIITSTYSLTSTGMTTIGSTSVNVTGHLGIGTYDNTWDLSIVKAQASSTGIYVKNSSASNGAASVLGLSNGTTAGYLYQVGTGYTPNGLFKPNATVLLSYASQDLVLAGFGGIAFTASPYTEQMRLTTTGALSFGSAGTGYGTSGQVLTSNGNAAPSWQTATAWSITGNAGTVANTNFIGTTDAVDIVFKRNSVRAGLLSSSNTSFGLNALNPSSSGTTNSAFGVSALEVNTIGAFNTSVGHSSLASNTEGTVNTALGVSALFANISGQGNTAIGVNALKNNTGSGSVGIGYFAGNYLNLSNRFFVNNRDLTNAAGDSTGSLIYGIFSTGQQYLRINAIPKIVDGNQGLGKVLTSDANGYATWQTTPGIQQSRVTAQFDKTANTTLANITGLTATLVEAATYRFEAILYTTKDAVGGEKYTIASDGTLTATAIVFEILAVDNTGNLNTITSRQTALGGSAGQASGTTGFTKINGTITVGTAGVISVQFAQNAANGTSSVLVGSTFVVTKM